jgi:hypothetical protein
MNIVSISKRGKELLGNRKWEFYEYREKVICFDNKSGYLFISKDKGWQGIWVRESGDKDFIIEGQVDESMFKNI